MKKFKLDNNIIEFKKIGASTFHIYVQYNRLKSQTDFIIDINNLQPWLYRVFTERQLNIFLNKLKKAE